MDIQTLLIKYQPLSGFEHDTGMESFVHQVRDYFEQTRWFILPYRQTSQSETVWYAFAQDVQHFKYLRTALNAFIGKSYAFCTTVSSPVEGPSHEVLIQSFSKAGFYKLTGGHNPTIQEHILKMLQCYSKVPQRQVTLRRPINLILRDFEFALHHDDQTGAQKALWTAKQSRVLSAQNLLFLNYIKLGHFRCWRTLLEDTHFKDMTRMARPLQVTQAMLDALYAVHIKPIERTATHEQLVGGFEKLLTRLGSTGTLFQGLKGLKGTGVAKLFILHDATSVPVYSGRAQQILTLINQQEVEITEPFKALLAKIVPSDDDQRLPLDMNTMSLEDLMSRVRDAYQSHHNDEVLDLLNSYMAVHDERSPALIEAYFLLAKEFDSLEVIQVALNLLKNVSESVRQEVLQRASFKTFFAEVTAFYTQDPNLTEQTEKSTVEGDEGSADQANLEPNTLADKEEEQISLADEVEAISAFLEVLPPLINNWIEWIDQLSTPMATSKAWRHTVKLITKGTKEWPKPSKEESVTIAQHLHELDDERRQALQDYLPQLITCLAQPHDTQEGLLPLHTWLIEQLLFKQNITSQTLQATFNIIEMMIAANIERDQLDFYLMDILDMWIDQASLDLLDWSMDMFELMITTQRPSTETQTQWGSQLESTLKRWIKRCSREQIELYNQLCAESLLQIQPIEWSSHLLSPETPLLSYLNHKYLAIYTLNESAGARVKARVLADAPKAKVEIFSEKGGHKSMTEAAKNADLFVIVTSCATHAATGSIEANRPRSHPTHRLHSSGSSSLLRVLLNYCDLSLVQSLSYG